MLHGAVVSNEHSVPALHGLVNPACTAAYKASFIDCKKLAPTWEELADSLSSQASKVSIAKVDGDAHKELSSKFSISGFPTIKWFDGKSDTPEDYNGGRDLEALQAFVAEKTGAKSKKAAKAPSAVHLLTDSSFSKAIGGEKGVFVAFTAPWCGRTYSTCKALVLFMLRVS